MEVLHSPPRPSLRGVSIPKGTTMDKYKIKERLRALGITMTAFAKLSGYDRSYLYNLIGDYKKSQSQLGRIRIIDLAIRALENEQKEKK